jgi:hypothetical protein
MSAKMGRYGAAADVFDTTGSWSIFMRHQAQIGLYNATKYAAARTDYPHHGFETQRGN